MIRTVDPYAELPEPIGFDSRENDRAAAAEPEIEATVELDTQEDWSNSAEDAADVVYIAVGERRVPDMLAPAIALVQNQLVYTSSQL